MDRASLNEIIELCSRLLQPAGYECIEAEWVGSERILRLYVDRLDSEQVTLDDCVAANGCLANSEQLDSSVPGTYTLEVSSPGVERPLRTEKHFAACLGETVNVSLTESIEGRKNIVGVIVSASDGEVSVSLAGDTFVFPIDKVKKAKLVYNW